MRLAFGGIAALVAVAGVAGGPASAWAASGTGGGDAAHAQAANTAQATARTAGAAGARAGAAGRTTARSATPKATVAAATPKAAKPKAASPKAGTTKATSTPAGPARQGTATPALKARPEAMTGLTISSAAAVYTNGVSGITVTWAVTGVAGDDLAAGISYYLATAQAANATTQTCRVSASGGVSYTCSIMGLTSGVNYTVSVAAVTAAGTVQFVSPTTTVQPGPPGAPTGVMAAAGNGLADVVWTAPTNVGNTIDHYTVTAYSGATPVATCPTVGPVTTCHVTGLSNGTAYTFKVVANGNLASGDSVASAASAAVTPSATPTTPTAPSSVRVTPGSNSATVSWNVPTFEGSGINQYTVTAYNTSGTATGQSCNTSGAGVAVTSCSVPLLLSGVPYQFVVVANGSAGDSPNSAPSGATVVGPPDAPANVTATGADTSIAVSWSAPSNTGAGISGYTATAWVGAVNSGHCDTTTTTTCTIGSLTNGTAYTITVVAHGVNATGDSVAGSPASAATPGIAPAAPTNVQASLTGTNSVTVTWTPAVPANGATINSYTVTALTGGVATGFQCLNTPLTACVINALATGVTYTFSVVATDNHSLVSPAGTSAALYVGPPSAPTGVTVTVGPGDGTITVAWTPPANSGTLSYAVTSTPPSAGCSPAAGATTCPVIGLLDTQSYTFTVTASNAGGSATATSAAITPGPPGAPTAVTAVAGDQQATVSWTAPSRTAAGVASYTATAYVGGSATLHYCTTPDGNTTTCTIQGLANGTTYTIQVFATGASGTGNSAVGTSGAVTPAAAPAAPTNVTVTPANMQLMVSWTASATGTVAHYSATATPGGETCATATGSQTSCTIDGVTPGTSYTVIVVATGTNGVDSAPSTASTATTPAGGPMTGPIVRQADGRLVAFARGSNNQLYYNVQATVGGTTWGGWTSLGGQLITNPEVARNADGTLVVFVFGADGSLWYKQQSAPNSTTWSSSYIGLGGYGVRPSSITVQTETDGRVVIFGRGYNYAIWYTAQTTPSGSTWTGWTSLGGALVSDPIVFRNPDGRMDVYARGFDNAVWEDTQGTAGDDTSWTGWTSLGTTSMAGLG